MKCERKVGHGGTCNRDALDGHKYCWQHEHGYRARVINQRTADHRERAQRLRDRDSVVKKANRVRRLCLAAVIEFNNTWDWDDPEFRDAVRKAARAYEEFKAEQQGVLL